MRIAFIDLLFTWPPRGGADVDLYHAARCLQDAGRTVHLFGLRCRGALDRGGFDPAALPFPATCLETNAAGLRPDRLCARLREAADPWRPDAVLLCDAFFLKPHLAEAFAAYPLAARYYAYEMACHRDILRFRDGAPCPKSYLHTPDFCRRCAFEALAPRIRAGDPLSWVQEYLAARAYAPEYHAFTRDALCRIDAAIVYNAEMARLLARHIPRVHIVPGGVSSADFPFTAMPPRAHGERKIIYLPGRAEDPAKGLDVLLAAAERLQRERGDFVIRANAPETMRGPECFEAIGWQPHAAVHRCYQEADICVVPSIWEEPFGMTALEAMSTGRPVCASRTGGLQNIVRDKETGFLFAPGDSADLAKQLSLLLDNPELRGRMGAAGHARVEAEYRWETLIPRHYEPILEEFALAMRR